MSQDLKRAREIAAQTVTEIVVELNAEPTLPELLRSLADFIERTNPGKILMSHVGFGERRLHVSVPATEFRKLIGNLHAAKGEALIGETGAHVRFAGLDSTLNRLELVQIFQGDLIEVVRKHQPEGVGIVDGDAFPVPLSLLDDLVAAEVVSP